MGWVSGVQSSIRKQMILGWVVKNQRVFGFSFILQTSLTIPAQDRIIKFYTAFLHYIFKRAIIDHIDTFAPTLF